MSRSPIVAPLEAARRLAVTKQHLAGPLPTRPTKRTLLSVVKDLAYVQWDPVAIVAPSHLLSLWNRVGDFRRSDLEELLWSDRRLFEHWIPMASIVRTDDYPLYASLMRRYPDSLTKSWGSQRTQARRFLAAHRELRKKVLRELQGGPLALSQFEDHLRTKRQDGDWTPRSDVEHVLFHLHMRGEVMVVGHVGGQNLWGLTDTFLPSWVEREPLSEEEFECEAAQRAIRALGTASPPEIHYYFVRGRYQDLAGALARLEEDSRVRRLVVEGLGGRDVRYIHADDIPLLDSMTTGAWQPRLSLLPPFDNLVSSTARTKRVFGFDYVREQFLPAEKRRFGTYVLPILWGERLIGRIDPRLDKATRTLEVRAVHAEPDAPSDRAVGIALDESIRRLAAFLGARDVSYPTRVPAAWKESLR